MNPHADAARLRKILRLSLAIQSFAPRGGMDSPADYARSLTPAAWKIIARTLGIHEPSPDTIADTIAALDEHESIPASNAVLLRNVMASQSAVAS